MIQIPGFTPTKEKKREERGSVEANKTWVPHSNTSVPVSKCTPSSNSSLKNRPVRSPWHFVLVLSDGGFTIFICGTARRIFCLQSYLDISFFANVGKTCMLKGGAWGRFVWMMCFSTPGKRMHLLGSLYCRLRLSEISFRCIDYGQALPMWFWALHLQENVLSPGGAFVPSQLSQKD